MMTQAQGNQDYDCPLEKRYINQIELFNFRSFDTTVVSNLSGPVVVHGPNGTGKTNLLEAVSLLSGQKGMRQASMGQVINFHNTNNSCYVAADIVDEISTFKLKININQSDNGFKKEILLNGGRLNQKTELPQMVPILWLTPQMDLFFMHSSSVRRKLLDQIVTNFYPQHGKMLNKLSYLHNQRLTMLKNNIYKDLLLDTIEQQISAIGVAIAAARQDVIERLNIVKNIQSLDSIAMICDTTQVFDGVNNALDMEVRYYEQLQQLRKKDAVSMQNSFGVHHCDLQMYFNKKNTVYKDDRYDIIESNVCSTGEQKLLVLELILAAAVTLQDYYKLQPILLLDEVMAHLDSNVRTKVLERLIAMNLQFWISSVDRKRFEYLEGAASFIDIKMI